MGHEEAVSVTVDKVRRAARAAARRTRWPGCGIVAWPSHVPCTFLQPAAGGSSEFGPADPNAKPFVPSTGLTTVGACGGVARGGRGLQPKESGLSFSCLSPPAPGTPHLGALAPQTRMRGCAWGQLGVVR